MASEPQTVIADAAAPQPDATDWMRSIAGQIMYLSSGDHAGLRRLVLTGSRAAEGTVVKLLTVARVPLHRQQGDFDRWRLIAHVAATLSGTGKVLSHAEGRRLGTALASADYSENRLLRLLAVRGEALHDQVRLLARILAQKGEQPVNLWTLYHLLGDAPDKVEAARLRIAHDYYTAAARSAQGASSDD